MKKTLCHSADFWRKSRPRRRKVHLRLLGLARFCLVAVAIGTHPINAADKVADEKLCNPAHLPSGLKVVQNIVFKQIGDNKLDLMLFPPPEKKFQPSPLVMYIHGGGWSGGDKYKVLRPQLISVIRELNKQGVTCASIEYRLAKSGTATTWDSAADCKDALRFLLKQADQYGIHPLRVGVFGESAGGHLALVTALGDDRAYPCGMTFCRPAIRLRCGRLRRRRESPSNASFARARGIVLTARILNPPKRKLCAAPWSSL